MKRENAKVQNSSKKRAESQPSGARFVGRFYEMLASSPEKR
jgi:hypothetical protein